MTPFVVLFVLNFLFYCSQNSSALLPPYLVSLGASQGYVGAYNTVGIVLVVAVVVVGGTRLVQLPRIRTLRIGFFFQLAASLLSFAFAHNLWLLMAFKILGSVGWVFAATLMLSVLFDVTPAQKRAGSLAIFSVGGMLTNPITSLAGEAVLRSFGGPGLFILAAIFALVCLAWSFLIHEPPAAKAVENPLPFFQVLARRDMRSLHLLAFAFGIFYSAITSFLPHHTLITLGAANLSAFLVPFSLISVAMRFVLGGQFDRRPPRRFLAWSFLSIGLAMILLILPAAWIWILVAGTLYGVGHSILYPLLNTLFVQKGGEEQKAVFSNAYLVVNLLGAVLTTPALGFLGDAAGFSAIIAVLFVVALAGYLLSRARFPRPTSPGSTEGGSRA